jgi:hypothetical protein
MLILSILFGAFQPPKPASGGPATLFWDLLQNNPQNRHPERSASQIHRVNSV